MVPDREPRRPRRELVHRRDELVAELERQARDRAEGDGGD